MCEAPKIAKTSPILKTIWTQANLPEGKHVYVYPPPGFRHACGETVLKLKKALCGMVESPLLWFNVLKGTLTKLWIIPPFELSGLLSFFGALLLEVFLLVLQPLLVGHLVLMFSLELQWITFISCWTNHLSPCSGCIGQLDLLLLPRLQTSY